MGDAGRKDEGAMQYAYLGRTGLQVSRIGLGTLAFGWKTSEADSFAIMDQALELGINLIDTANVYGEPQPPVHPGGKGIAEQISFRSIAPSTPQEGRSLDLPGQVALLPSFGCALLATSLSGGINDRDVIQSPNKGPLQRMFKNLR